MHEQALLHTLRVATYNIHKGVQGLARRRLEIHNLGHAVEQLDADIVCLQEVRKHHHLQANYFTRWPELPQADYLAPEGYEAVYRTNAFTRHGEHGNALLSRWPVLRAQHEDISDHRFEQRGLLHTEVAWGNARVHVIVIHFGLVPASRARQAVQLMHFIRREIGPVAPLLVAGDFNDWGQQVRRILQNADLQPSIGAATRTYPSRLPVVQLDHIYSRGLSLVRCEVPRGRIWTRMSDHLPLLADFVPARP